jgi:glutamate carboxypeptidase
MQNLEFDKLKNIVEINSWTKNKEGVDISANIFALWLKDIGFKLNRHQRGHIGDHLHFVSNHREGKKLLLLGHLDTVFPPDTFKGFKEDKEWIYGAGVCDMKGGNFVAYKALENIYKSFGEIYNIDFLLVSDEETGSDDSKFLTMKLAHNYDYCMVFEASGVNGEVVEARKGVGTFFIDIEGKASHAGNHYNSGIDANLEASQKLIRLVKLTDLSKGTTLNVGKIEGGIGANTISPHSKLTFELRYTNSNEKSRVLKEIDKIVAKSFVDGTRATLSGGIQRDVMQPSKKQKEFIDKINKLCNTSLLLERRGGVSDANIISSCGVATLDGFGPYGDGDHTINERANKESFIKRIELVTNIFKRFLERKFD